MASFGFAVEPRFRIAEKRFFEQRRATFAHAQEQSREKNRLGNSPSRSERGGGILQCVFGMNWMVDQGPIPFFSLFPFHSRAK
jgi:hypothetical protein